MERKIQYKKGNNLQAANAPVQKKFKAAPLTDNRPQATAQLKPNRTGLPDNLKSGIENLSGYSMDDVRVHYNSARPAQLNAHAYAQGSEIHIASGQEKHLPHEAWHVVQQKQGRVKPTMQMKGKAAINDDSGLEKEADAMGGKALQMKKNSNQNLKMGNTKLQTIQRAGVKSELNKASNNLDVLEEETKESKQRLGIVSEAIYNRYKPIDPVMGFHESKKDNDAPLKINRIKDAHTPAKHAYAMDSAQRLTHWTDTAVNSAARILEELAGTMKVDGVDPSSIKMGINTDTEPDVLFHNITGEKAAFESKRVDSAAQGAVDSNIISASIQLEKRYKYSQKLIPSEQFKHYVANIKVINPNNPWPYTPSAYGKAQKNGFHDFNTVLYQRLSKYKGQANATINITYQVTLPNGKIHIINV